MRQHFSTNQEWVQANGPLGIIGVKGPDDCWHYVTKKPVDMVNHPPHYTQGNVECIEAIQAALSPEEYVGFLRGQIIKYVWRLNQKDDPLENAQKARFYLNKLIALYAEPTNV